MTQTIDFDYLVFIGRFQPFHIGHQYVVEIALKHAHEVILLIGSANTPRTPKNPFTADERISMIRDSFSEDSRSRLHCLPINDAPYQDNKWLIGVQNAISSVTQKSNQRTPKIAIIGHNKDESSYYLSLFPQFDSFMVDNFNNLSATPLRHAYLGDDDAARTQAYAQMTPASSQFAKQFIMTDSYAKIKAEFDHIDAYQAAWACAPYPPSFITADALVVQSGHILLIERGGAYGQGFYALPGGFVDNGEDFLSAAIRELGEETQLAIDKHKLLAHLKSSRLFDAPKRSARARTVSMVYYFELPSYPKLPAVQGADDANRAFWLPLSKLDARLMFEDHYGIICSMLSI